MTREEAARMCEAVVKPTFGTISSNDNNDAYKEAFEMAIAALREIDAMYVTNTIGESMVKTPKQACPYCSWIDPELLEEDEVDGPQNYCRVCGRDLRR